MKNKKDIWFQGETLWFNNKPPIINEVKEDMDVYITDLSNICTGLELCHITHNEDGVFIWVAFNTGFKVTRHLIGYSNPTDCDDVCPVEMWDGLYNDLVKSDLFVKEIAPLVTNGVFELMIEKGCVNPVELS